MSVEENNVKLSKHTEFETKYRVDGSKIYDFKLLMENKEYVKFTYAEGPDAYYTKLDGSFLRYRKALTEKRSEVTFKEKPSGANTNIKRKEVNWRVDSTSKETIHEGAIMQGYRFNFSIFKICHIYKFKDVTLVFYTVKDEDNKLDHFIEIELDEETIHKLTHDEAMNIIKKYEDFLSPLGISYRHRLSKSLFEMYAKDLIPENKMLVIVDDKQIAEVKL